MAVYDSIVYSMIVTVTVSSIVFCSLNLETTRTTTSTSLFEFASLTADIGLDSIVGMRIIDGRRVSKVRQGFAALGSSQQDDALSLGRAEGQLIQGNAFSSGGRDAFAGSFGETECADGHFGAFEHAHIVRDFSDNDSSLSFLLGHVFGESVESHGWSVDLGHVETFEDSRTEFGVCSARQEFIQLDEEFVVRIGSLDLFHGRLVAHAATSGFQIDTHGE